MDKYLERSLRKQCNGNLTLFDAFVKADSIVNNPKYKKIVCSVSGGSDSDCMLDLIHRIDADNKVEYIWFDTGLEYQATKNHLEYLKSRYGITIERECAVKPIPLCVKEYGQPFVSKNVSENISRLQRFNFDWTDITYKEGIEKYPECACSIKWWCNAYEKKKGCEDLPKQFNIEYNLWLKEFLMQNPPKFKISKVCCDWAKKKTSKQFIKKSKCDLMITGIRKGEGGIRSMIYKNCFTAKENETSYYRPLFWFTPKDKEQYEKYFSIVHSDCYTKWGFVRTGCVGCPFNIHIFENLDKIEQYEPNLFTACNNIFKQSYEYTKQYREFQRKMSDKRDGKKRLF